MPIYKLFTSPHFTAKFHACAVFMWMMIGILGLVQYGFYLHDHPHAWEKTLRTPVAASIPVLYFISVYANVVGHWEAFQSATFQKKNDE